MTKEKISSSEMREDSIKIQDDIFEQLTRETEPAIDRMIRETVQQLFNKENIYMITDLNIDQINQFYKLIIIDKLFYQKYAWREKEDNPEEYYKFTSLFNLLLELAVSKGRQGRTEFIEMLGRLREEQKIRILEERMKGRGG